MFDNNVQKSDLRIRINDFRFLIFRKLTNIINILKEKELDLNSVVKDYLTTDTGKELW
jgi:hypothetical protein